MTSMDWKEIYPNHHFDEAAIEALEALTELVPMGPHPRHVRWSWLWRAMKNGALQVEEYRRILALANGH